MRGSEKKSLLLRSCLSQYLKNDSGHVLTTEISNVMKCIRIYIPYISLRFKAVNNSFLLFLTKLEYKTAEHLSLKSYHIAATPG